MQAVLNGTLEAGVTPVKRFSFSVGRIGLTLCLNEAGWLDLSDSLSTRFTTDSNAPVNDYNLELTVEGLPAQSLRGPAINGQNWHFESQGDQSRLYWRPPLADKGWTHFLELDLANRQGRLQLLRPEGWSRLTYGELFPGLLDKFILTMLLNRLEGCLVHGASLADGPRGLLLVGDSGTGKSTSSRLWQSYGGTQVRCLSDESSLVRKINGQFWVFGTPWPSLARVADPAGVALDRLYFLRHAPFNQAHALDSRTALLKLLQQGRFSFWDSQGVGAALDILVELAETIPTYELGFVPDKSVITFVRSLEKRPHNS